MKTVGIIAEYNPFHNGHKYQIQQVRRNTGADYVIAAMSGDFVQRGEPAIYDKYTRTQMALNSGIDLVLELPCAFATSSAEDFASSGVSLLNQLGVVDTLCFGSECGQMEPLTQIAALFSEESIPYQTHLKELIKQGNSYPKARQQAAIRILSAGSGKTADILERTLSSPNNILGIEYLKALRHQKSNIEPYTILRSGHNYHDSDISSADHFASASALRSAIKSGTTKHLITQMPTLPVDTAVPIFPDDLSALMNYRLLDLIQQNVDLTCYLDVSSELADRIYNLGLQFSTFSQRIEALKTKQYTYTRISRALLHILLGITDEQITAYKEQHYTPYARILGFQKNAAPLLSQLKEQSSLPLITKTADAKKVLSADAMMLFRQDLHSSHIYQSLMYQKSGVLPRNEYTHSIVIL